MKRYVLLLLFSPGVLGAFQNESWGARHRGLAGIGTALRSDPSCAAENPASLHSVSELTVLCSATPALFGLSELKTLSLISAVPLSWGTVGAGARTFGFDLYRETSVLAGAGLPLDDRLTIGLTSEMRHVQIKHYGSETLVICHAGIQLQLGESLVLGGAVLNILASSLGPERFPRSASAGISFAPGDRTLIACEIEKDSRNPLVIRIGGEFSPVPFLALRGGVKSNPHEWALGATCDGGFVVFAYGGSIHELLGWTNQVDVAFRVFR